MGGKTEKAYKNLEFLNSAEARSLRILSEYLEPKVRFQKQNVENTIVFFGSARLTDKVIAKQNFEFYQKKYNSNSTEKNKWKKNSAQKRLELAQYYEDARTLARMLTEWSFTPDRKHQRYLIASGGGPGIMEAANRGAWEVPGGRSVGLNISIPLEQDCNPYITDELNFEFHYFFTRKFWFVYLAKAMVAFPGGFGTLDELFESLTLLQTKKVNKKMPVVLYGKSYWKKMINFDFLLDNFMISKEDLNLIFMADTPEEAFEFLKSEINNG